MDILLIDILYIDMHVQFLLHEIFRNFWLDRYPKNGYLHYSKLFEHKQNKMDIYVLNIHIPLLLY